MSQYHKPGWGVLGIEGKSGAGKSTIAFDIAPALGATIYDTGMGLRGFAVWAMSLGVDPHDEAACSAIAKVFSFSVIKDRVMVAGVDVTDELRTHETTVAVQAVSGYAAVRSAFAQQMRVWIARRPAVVIGRHLHELFPSAQLVIMITRHHDEVKQMRQAQEGDVAAEWLLEREASNQRNRAVALAEGGKYQTSKLDTTGMNKAKQAAAVLALAQKAGFRIN